MAYIKNFDFDPLIGQQVGTSVLLKKLDQGSMSVVFVAFQKTLKRQIAVKILPKLFLTPKISELFQQEAQAAAFLSHPCIIPVYEVGETDDFLFFTMQLVRGASLSHYIRRARKNVIPSKRVIPLKDSLKIIIKVLDKFSPGVYQTVISGTGCSRIFLEYYLYFKRGFTAIFSLPILQNP